MIKTEGTIREGRTSSTCRIEIDSDGETVTIGNAEIKFTVSWDAIGVEKKRKDSQ